MTNPVDATLAAYQSRALEYLRGSARPVRELIAHLDRFANLARPGPVLEIGSAWMGRRLLGRSRRAGDSHRRDPSFRHSAAFRRA